MARQVKRGTAWGCGMLVLSPFVLVFLVLQTGESSPMAPIYLFLAFVGFVVWGVRRANRPADNTRRTNPQRTTAPARGVPVTKPSRTIPQDVKIAVSVRDQGKCRVCGSTKDLHYDHIIPYSRGGLSNDPNNIQLLCGYHNRLKSNR